MKKSTTAIWTVILLLVLLFFYIKNISKPEVPEEVAKCIGENSIVYSQVGCHYCELQKEMFGENYKYINDFSCNGKWDECQAAGVSRTPTWEIGGQNYQGVQDIKRLRELTGC